MELHPARDESGAGIWSGRYEVAVRLHVRDPGCLWRMAAARMLACGGSGADVEEMFGPMEDPSIIDCIAMLVGPGNLAGCSFEEFSVLPASSPISG